MPSLKVIYCIVVVLFTDCSTLQRPAIPPQYPAPVAEDTSSSHFICTASTPAERPSSHQLTSAPLHSPSTAINAVSPLPLTTNGGVTSPTKASREHKKIATFSRSTSVPNEAKPFAQNNQTDKITLSPTRSKTNQDNQETMTEKRNAAVDLKSSCKARPAAAVSTETPAVPLVQTRRALFSPLASHIPVRRAKSEGHVRMDGALAGQSAVPEVFTDATMNDRLWSKLEPGSYRDSMSSSSSISSSDTVIDLSLPNLARRSLVLLPNGSKACEPSWVSCRHSALVSYNTLRVSKSKSNPNLQQSDCPKDELKPRPLQPPQDVSEDSPSRLTQRRHTWSRLYMEGLKQSSARASPASAKAPPANSTMSKSLGDLTSDDISCNFDSKYRSISRSFIVRPTRDQLRKGSPQKSRPHSDLTEQLRKLTDVEPLTASDFAPENRPKDSQEDSVDETLVRRTSSRSQSRVRYIANRAKKAQERQRLQGLVQGRSASFRLAGTGSLVCPIEERGNPEGACCVAHSPCSGLDLLSQLTPLESSSPVPPHSSQDPENSDFFFRLKL